MAAARVAASGQDRGAPPLGPTAQSVRDAAPYARAFADAQPVADAVLYEGYVLYPYRKSSTKNQGPRWQFGVLSPRAAIVSTQADDTSVAGSVESWFQQTECLLEGADDSEVAVRLRFLQLQRKTVEQRAGDGSFRAVAELDVDGRLHVSFDEALPREHDVIFPAAELLGAAQTCDVEYSGCDATEELTDGAGRLVGRLVRCRQPVSARITVRLDSTDAPFPLRRLRIRTENAGATVPPGLARGDVLASSLLATHCFVGISSGRFVSLLDPPEWAADAARQCANVHTFPVLAGAAGTTNVVLSSPIILYDHPQVAPESPGDLFDATEIDEILSLRTLALSDAEKREARATDPRAAEIIDRVDAMPAELLAKLHGAVRSLRPVSAVGNEDTSPDDAGLPWWHPEADAALHPEVDEAQVIGGAAAKGSAVRIRPRRRGSDAHDMFLAGRIARVERVLLDVDGSVHVAVTVGDDPAAELHEWYGRFHYFSPGELELVEGDATDLERAP